MDKLTVQSEIRSALMNIPVKAIPSLNVTFLYRGWGKKLSKCASASTTTATLVFDDCAGTPSDLPAGELSVGDVIRIGSQLRTVVSLAAAKSSAQASVTLDQIIALGGVTIAQNTPVYKTNGWSYMVDFSGENMRNKKGVVGSVPELVCEDALLTPSSILSQTALVTVASPTTITFASSLSSAAGDALSLNDLVRIGNQTVRVVSAGGDTSSVTVSPALQWNSESYNTNIFPSGTAVWHVLRATSTNAASHVYPECHATDMPIMSTTSVSQDFVVDSDDLHVVTHGALVNSDMLRAGRSSPNHPRFSQ